MADISNGKYTAKITAILDAVYRSRNKNRLEDGYFIQFQINSMGSKTLFSELVSDSPHHKGKLYRLVSPLMQQLKQPIGGFKSARDRLLNQLVDVEVKSGKDGKQFQFLRLRSA